MDNRPIGIFDSGVGGLTVVKEVIEKLPMEKIIYFGDTARVPYGSKSKETITKFSIQIVNFLLSEDVKAVIIACNTASANSYDALTEIFNIPFVEMVIPGVESSIEITKNNVIGVIGTEGTIRSKAYENLIIKKRENIKVYSKACPLFVPLAEEGWSNNSVAKITAEIYLQELIDKEIDTLILGCTHYPLLYDCIKQTIGSINIINPAKAASTKILEFLTNNNLLREENEEPIHKFFVSDNTEKFNKICKLVLNKNYLADKINIESY